MLKNTYFYVLYSNLAFVSKSKPIFVACFYFFHCSALNLLAGKPQVNLSFKKILPNMNVH